MYAQLNQRNFSSVNISYKSASAWLVENDSDQSPSLLEKWVGFFSIKHLIKKIKESNEDIKQKTSLIENAEVNKESIRQASEFHKSLIKLLDFLYFIKELDTSTITNGSAIELADEMKKAFHLLMDYELAIRLKFFPDKNKVLLNYEEMKELRDCMKGWEPAEEQSDLYS